MDQGYALTSIPIQIWHWAMCQSREWRGQGIRWNCHCDEKIKIVKSYSGYLEWYISKKKEQKWKIHYLNC